VRLSISSDAEDKFLYGTLVLVNDYKCTKFQLPSCIIFGDMVGSVAKLLDKPDDKVGRCE